MGMGYSGGRVSGWLGYTHPEPQKRTVHILLGCFLVRKCAQLEALSNILILTKGEMATQAFLFKSVSAQ